MIVKIFNKSYRMDQALAMSAKKVVLQILEKVRSESELHGIGKYYTAFVIMMYVVSASILRELNPDRVMEILDKGDKGHPGAGTPTQDGP